MSTNNIVAEAVDMMMCCASCGIAKVDDKKLKECAACDLVRYCSDDCEQEHRPKHDAICKKGAAELRDEILFRQPESSHRGDCPLCFLPLSLDHWKKSKKSVLMGCCSKTICKGCYYANGLREIEENLQQTCPFCRHPLPTTEEEFHRNKMKRAEANDPVAMREMGLKHCDEGDYSGAVEYWTKAAALGDADAHCDLSFLYQEGKGVEKDEERETYHLEEAAIAGHAGARCYLGCTEFENCRVDRAVKHFIIAANLGHDDSLQILKQCYENGDVSKDDFATALRAHQAAIDAMKSPQREAAAKAMAA